MAMSIFVLNNKLISFVVKFFLSNGITEKAQKNRKGSQSYTQPTL